MLPNGYKYLYGLTGNGAYIDTGVTPSSTLKIEALFTCNKLQQNTSQATGYIFGARNSNSNTSAGQLNLYIGANNGADYVGWRSARISQNMGSNVWFDIAQISNEANVFSLLGGYAFVSEFDGSTDSFTGTRNIYLFGLNNGGSFTKCLLPVTIFGFKIWDNGTLIRDFIPAMRESDSELGMYEAVEGVFYTTANGTPFESVVKFEITDSEGGRGGFYTTDGEYTNEIYVYLDYTIPLYACPPLYLKAFPNDGYVFSKWELNGSEISSDIETTVNISDSPKTYAPVFQKMTSLTLDMGYRAMSLFYNATTSGEDRAKTYYKVIRANIKEDFLQRSTSTIECEEMPSTVHINTPIFLYDPRGKIIYYGVVKSVEGKTLTCREPLSVVDDDYLLETAVYNAHQNPMFLASFVMNLNGVYDSPFVKAKKEDFTVGNAPIPNIMDSNRLLKVPMPSIESNQVVNAEDYIIGLYSKFGVGVRYALKNVSIGSVSVDRMAMSVFYPKLYDTLVIGDNMECVTNISITTKEADATVLQIYNANGSTLKATYYMGENGELRSDPPSIGEMPRYVAYNTCKLKIVMDDDNVKTVAKEHLNASLYNHKISLTLHLGGLIRFEDIHLGQPVRFYYQGEMFDTVITGLSYTIEQNSETIHAADVTLGNVRTNLTSKLNLGKK